MLIPDACCSAISLARHRYVHSLHHRNTDIDPFSGLCMHPVEHLYYYSCVGPSLVFLMSPLGMYWNLVHLLISPAASHSGCPSIFRRALLTLRLRALETRGSEGWFDSELRL